MASRSQVLDNIQRYEKKLNSTQYNLPESSSSAAHEARLDKTISELNARIEKERATLEELKARSKVGDLAGEYHSEHGAQLRQLQIVKSAYKDLTPSAPQLPPSDSAVPPLLALRSASKVVSETRESIRETHSSLQNARSRLSKEQSDLRDADLLSEALQKRIESLQSAKASKAQQAPDEAARALVETEATRKKSYDQQTRQTMRALITFVGETLAPMLAAEELGGPVVGEMLEVSDEILAAGFNDRHKPKKGKAPTQDKRQRRIDEIWGAQGEDEQFEEDPRSEAQAAGDEMKTLIEDLLNAIAEGGTGRWVKLNRDSAAARFLVRSGIAILHRTDARKIRLVDFGREADD